MYQLLCMHSVHSPRQCWLNSDMHTEHCIKGNSFKTLKDLSMFDQNLPLLVKSPNGVKWEFMCIILKQLYNIMSLVIVVEISYEFPRCTLEKRQHIVCVEFRWLRSKFSSRNVEDIGRRVRVRCRLTKKVPMSRSPPLPTVSYHEAPVAPSHPGRLNRKVFLLSRPTSAHWLPQYPLPPYEDD